MSGDAKSHPYAHRPGRCDFRYSTRALKGGAGVERGGDLASASESDTKGRGAGCTPSPGSAQSAGRSRIYLSSPSAWTPAAKYLATTSSVVPSRTPATAVEQMPRWQSLRDRGHVVADEQDRPALLADVVHLAQALVLERRVADRQHLVDEQDLRLEVGGDGEGQPHVHAARVALDRRVEELARPRRRRRSRRTCGDLGLAACRGWRR